MYLFFFCLVGILCKASECYSEELGKERDSLEDQGVDSSTML